VFSFDLMINALVVGVLLGGFYCALAMGLSVSFGLLDVVNIAHPAFIILGSYVAYMMGELIGLDPILTGIIFAPVFFVLGLLIYRIYYESFEKRGAEALRGLAFFFGLMFIVEVALIIFYGVDYRSVVAGYVGPTLEIGFVGIPYRMLVPFIVSMCMALILVFYLSKTFTGRAIKAVAQDRMALQLMGADPTKIKQLAFGISLATCSIAGALLIIIIPVEPSVGRLYIGPVFAIVVLAGLGSINGTIYAAIIIGVAESIVNAFFGPSWAPAVAFGILLAVLGLRPSGLFGR
jgi:branched-chain amino acid transport system permease protein